MRMVNAADIRRPPEDRSGVASSVEVAVRRLVKGGFTRAEALSKICQTLHVALGMLNAVGIGDTARLRAQMMAAEAKVAEISRAHESEDENEHVG